MLADVLARDGAELSASVIRQRNLANADHLATLHAIWTAETTAVRHDRYRDLVTAALPPGHRQPLSHQARWLFRIWTAKSLGSSPRSNWYGRELHLFAGEQSSLPATFLPVHQAVLPRSAVQRRPGGTEPVTASVSGLLRDLAYVRQARSRCLRCCPGVAVVALGRPSHRARGGHDLLIRRKWQVVQDRLSPVVRWADVPYLSAHVSRCPVARQQYWQQPEGRSIDPRHPGKVGC